MAIDFPNSPTTNQEYTVGNIVWKYDGEKWIFNSLVADPLSLSDSTPLIESGSGSAGTGGLASRSDHVHPAATGGDYLLQSTASATYLTIANASATYITGNQTITLSGDASGSGTTAITVTVADDSHAHTGTTISNLDTGDITTGTLAVARGGTGTGTTPTNGQLLIGNGTNYTLATLSSGNGITVSNSAGSVTITNSGVLSVNGSAGAVTGLATSASPTFTGIITTPLTVNNAVVFTDSSGVLRSTNTALATTYLGVHSSGSPMFQNIQGIDIVWNESGLTNKGIVYYGGISLGSTGAGTNNQILVSQGGGTLPPTFADLEFLVPYSRTGTLATAVGTIRYRFPWGATILGVTAAVNTAPTGASIICDVNKNGTTIFTTQANRPTIAVSTNATTTEPTPNVTSMLAGDYLTVDIDQIGSTIAGSDLTVIVRCARA